LKPLLVSNEVAFGNIISEDIRAGRESAMALAVLDQKRDQWQQRLAVFNAKYDSISAYGLSGIDQETAVNALLASDFDAIESIRVRALTGL
jgi:lipase chaperone LimK